MGAFGDKLRREREMRGIALSEISESTKISKRWLKALEDDQFDLLPGGVFNRGFVRAYARFLGINEEQAVADYVAASNEQEPPEDKFPLDIHQYQRKNNHPPLNPKRSFVPVLLAIVVLIVSGWTVWIKRKPQGGTGAQQPSTAPVNSPTSPRGSTPQSSSQSSGAPDKESPSTLQSDKLQSPRASADDLKPKGSFSVVIKAKKDSWISIVADGQTLWEGTLNASTERSIQAGKELVLKTGNAAGIDVSYNGKPLGILGKEKEVRTITFNTAGLQR